MAGAFARSTRPGRGIEVGALLREEDGAGAQLAIGPRNLFHHPCRRRMAQQGPRLIRDKVFGLMQAVRGGKEVGEQVHQGKEETALQVGGVAESGELHDGQRRVQRQACSAHRQSRHTAPGHRTVQVSGSVPGRASGRGHPPG